MRKNLITHDYRNTPKSGAINMHEVRNFGVSKAMYIDESFIISGNMVMDFITKPIISNTVSTLESSKNPIWTMDIRHVDMLVKYLYDNITQTPNDFEALNPVNTHDGNINNAVNDYIRKNLIRAYKLSDIYMWTEYHKLVTNKVTKGIDTYTLLMNNPIFRSDIKPIEPYINSEKLTLSTNKDITNISFKQLQDASIYTYFYNLEFKFIRI